MCAILLWMVLSMPCDAACQARMDEPMPLWPWAIVLPLGVVAWQPQLAYMGYIILRNRLKRER